MDAQQSVKIIEQMLKESKRHLLRNSFYFIFWACLLIPTALAEFFLMQKGFERSWMVWYFAGPIGGIVSYLYGARQGKKAEVLPTAARIVGFVWGAAGVCIIFSIAYAIFLKQPPHAMILMISGAATFVTGGISKFKPFVWGGIALAIGAVVTAFFVEAEYHSLVFAISLLVGYLIPGLRSRKIEHEQA
ncbi:MAG: hypothetical protein MI810_16565 [Flavobacteriales bacterium]|jgi:hypothetical protein|nr:hypothetical protein [Flavobacteriales bacterium]